MNESGTRKRPANSAATRKLYLLWINSAPPGGRSDRATGARVPTATDQSCGLRVSELHPYFDAGLDFAWMRVGTRRNRQSELKNRPQPPGILPR
jgi:hypothetical protein